MVMRSAARAAFNALPPTARRTALRLRYRRSEPQRVTASVPVRPRDSDLVFVLSLPRSGTNAFGALLRNGFPGLTWEGEILYGHFRPETAQVLAERFPWVTTFAGVTPRTHSAAKRQEMHRQLRAQMNEHASELLAALIEGRTGATVVKVFPAHLDRAVLARLLAEYRPRVIDIRRRLVFSYVSYLKATSTGVWSREVAPDHAVEWSQRGVDGYIARCDEWTRWYSDVVARLGLERLRVSYEQLYETRTGLASLRAFFAEESPSPLALDDDLWAPPTVIQDRRSDTTLAALLRAFGDLPESSRVALLREPGD